MNLDNYTVAVKINLIENVSKGLVGMASQFATLTNQANSFQNRIAYLRSELFKGAEMFAAGSAMVTPFIAAAVQGGKLEQQLKNIQLATHASTIEMEKFHDSILKTSMKSIFDETTVAKIAKNIALSGNFNATQVQLLTPQFTKYAQVQSVLKNTPVETSVDQAIKLAEITGHFDPKSIQVSLNALTKLSLLMPGSVDKVLSAFQYMQGTMKNIMGASDENTLMMTAFLQRMGIQGTRAGSQMIGFVTRTIPQVFGSGLWQGQSLPQLTKMGMLDANGVPKIYTNGKFDPMKLMRGISEFATRTMETMPEAQARATIMQTFAQIFGVNGTRQASIFINPEAINAYKEVSEQYKRHPDLDQLLEQTNHLFVVVMKQSMAGLSTVVQELGYAILPVVTQQFEIFNVLLSRTADWINKNKTLVANVFKGVEIIGGLLAIGGAFHLLRAGLMGTLIPFQILTRMVIGFIPFMAGVVAPFLLIITTSGVLGYALYKLYINFDKISQAIADTTMFKILNAGIDGFTLAVTALMHPLETVTNMLNALGNYINPPVKQEVSPLTNPIGWVNQKIHRAQLHEADQREKGLDFLGLHPIKMLSDWFSRSKDNQVIKENSGVDFLGYHPLDWISKNILNHRELPSNEPVTVNQIMKNNGVQNNEPFSYKLPPAYYQQQKKDEQNRKNNSENNNESGNETNSQQGQNVSVNIILDGHKLGSVLLNNMVRVAGNGQSSGSLFDSRLSPMPTIINNTGY